MKPSKSSIILKSLVGSHAYGLQTKQSDKDYVGIFIAPTSEIAGLDWRDSNNTWTNAAPGIQSDETYMEIAHFFKQMLNGNPNLFEIIHAPNQEISHAGYIAWLKSSMNNIYGTESVRKKMMGFAINKMKELDKFSNYNYKSVRTVLLKSAGIKAWLQTGEYRFDLFDSKLTDYLQEAPRQVMIDLLESECYHLENIKAANFLHREPSKIIVKAKLADIRKDNFEF